MEKSSSVERQLFILSLLSQNKKGYTVNEIVDSLQNMADIEVTRRIVLRDMDYISQNFFVYEEEHGATVYYKADKYVLSDIDFTISEIIALYFVKEVLTSYKSLSIASDALKIVDRIFGKLPNLSQTTLANIEKMIKIVPVATMTENIDEKTLQTLTTAVSEKRCIDVSYSSFSKGETVQRRFDPYVLEIREGCWHSIGFCHLRKAVRDLRVSRMNKICVTDEKFEIPQRFYEEYQKTRFDKLAGDKICDITIKFENDAARLLNEYYTHKADDITNLENGDLIFHKRASITPDLVSWVLSFGAEVQVLEPPELKECLAQQAKKMMQLYADETEYKK
ncbi:MAG: WYL domain-containing protein [Christensenellaceae bacterium]